MISVLTIQQADEWNRIVKSFQHYDIYYLSNYVKAFNLHGDGEPLLFLYEDDQMRAINIVMKRDIAHDERFTGEMLANTYYDIATPYGYGGFLIEGTVTKESLKALDQEYSARCHQEGIVSEIVRFHPVLNNHEDVYDMYDICQLGKTITVSLSTKEEIWKNLNSNKKRWIKKAREAGVEVYWGRSPDLLTEFKHMYNGTMRGNNAKDYYYFNEAFYESVMKDLAHHSLIFYARYKGETIAMVLVIYSNGKIHHHLSASEIEYQHLAATNLVMYEIACWASENGFKTFHMGGGVGSREDSLYQFKQGFNKQSNTNFAIGKKIFDQQKYNQLIEIRTRECPINELESFFPLYRV